MKNKKIFIIVSFLLLPSLANAIGPFTLPFSGNQSINAYMDLDSRFDWVYDYIHRTPWQESITGWSLGYAYDGHQGTDYNLSNGTEVKAAAAGTVTEILDGQGNTYPGCSTPTGNKVLVDHSGNYQSRYYHLSSGSLEVNDEDAVLRGQHLADSGNSGCSTGAHLHFEVRYNGTATDSYENSLWATNPASQYLLEYTTGIASVTYQTIGRPTGGHSRAGLMWKPTSDQLVCAIDYHIAKVGTPTDALKLRVYIENSGTTSTNPENNTTLTVSNTGTAITVPTASASFLATSSTGQEGNENHRYKFNFSSCLTVPANRKTWFDLSRTGVVSNTNYYDYNFYLNANGFDRTDTQRYRRAASDGTWTLESDGGSEMLFRAYGF